MSLTVSEKIKDILSYESTIWAAGDTLRSSVGLKNSEYPDYMIPFFALMLVESRLIRLYDQVNTDERYKNYSLEDKIAEIKDYTEFYNSYIIEEGITLADIVMNDHGYEEQFELYLNGFSNDLKRLLGIIDSNKTENLNFNTIKNILLKKGVLFSYLSSWSKIDLTPYDNSEVTTLEEHIKRKWADISGETSGEQYTPSDIINLISELVLVGDFDSSKNYKLYDMTCGGGNMVFGVEDRIKIAHPGIVTSSFGQELIGSLYSLAKIESMFRSGSDIKMGNTLTNDKFAEVQFDYGVANPPYGVSWKDMESDIKKDETGRFGHGGYPAISDGQLLFVQHMLAKLNDNGKAFIVLNGSPLFSGGAGSGESDIRKWILDNDYLEALIQLPNGEFFNTGITTYIWCLNKNKVAEKKDKILLIDASNDYVKLRKSKGSKTNEITDTKSIEIASIYHDFKETDTSKVLSKYDFYYNRQKIERLETDEEFGSVEEINLTGVVSILVKDKDTLEEVFVVNRNDIEDISKENATEIQKKLKSFDTELFDIIINKDDDHVYNVSENNCIISSCGDISENLGFGEFKFNITFIKESKTSEAEILLGVKIIPVWNKDEERIDFSNNDNENLSLISSFIKKWVSVNEDNVHLLDNTVGVEINFNRFFYKKAEDKGTQFILSELSKIDLELEALN